MDSGAAFVLQSGILWVLLILVGVLVGSWLIVIYWDYSISRALEEYPAEFDNIQGEIKKILQEIQTYSSEDPLPYGPIVAGITQQVDTIANRLTVVKKLHVDTQTKHHRMSARPLRYILGAPVYVFTWYGLIRNTARIRTELVELQSLAANARAQERELDKQAWLLASRVRASITLQENVHRMMDYLGNQKLYGDTYDAMVEKEDLVVEAIEHIPEYFLIDEEDGISSHAGKFDVWIVYKILSEVEPLLNDMHERLTLWINQYDALAEKANHHQDQLDHLKQLVNAAPHGMELTAQQTQLVALGETMRVLLDTLSRLEVESIELVGQELDQVHRIIIETSTAVRQGFNNCSKLNGLLSELTELQSEVSEVYEKLVRASTYPIIWDRSSSAFMDVNKRIKHIGTIDSPRTLEEIETALIEVQELLVSLRGLSAQINDINGDHQDMLELFSSEEIQNGLDRFQEYYQLSDQISLYDSGNWLKADSAATYIDDVQNLETAHKVFLGRDHTKSIPESEVKVWHQKAGELTDRHKQLAVRSEKLLARLQFVKRTESEAKEELATVQKAFNQLKWLVNSNPLLKKVAASDIEKISTQVVQCNRQLEQTHSGIIEDKLRRVQSLRGVVESAGRKWLDILNQDINQRKSLLKGKIEVICNIASLEDPGIEKAQRLLGGDAQSGKLIQPEPAFHLPFEDIIAELKRQSLQWQELVAVQTEVEEIVETPLVGAYNHAETQRKTALDALAAASRVIPEKPQWPPCSVSISEERREMGRLELIRSEITGKNTRAIWAVRQFGELAASYQTLAGKVQRSKEWALHEQKRITDIEGEIERNNKKLQQLEQLVSDDPGAVEQVRLQRAQAKLSIEKQKQRWSLSAPMTPEVGEYEEILQSLIETARILRAAVDDLRTEINVE